MKIVITGATRGLGFAMTKNLIQKGHQIASCGRSKEQIESLKKQFGSNHFFEILDVTNDEEVKSFSKRVLQSLGAPDLLINNAAITLNLRNLWEFSAQEFGKVMDVNVNGTVNMIRHFVPAMVNCKKGIIINFSSGWGRSVDAGVAPYCASKWAIEGLTKALALELPPGMAAVALNPGIIDTDMLRQCWGEGAGRYPKSEEWAKRAVPFLLNLSEKDNGKSVTVH